MATIYQMNPGLVIIRQQGSWNSFQILPILGIVLENEVSTRVLKEDAKYCFQKFNFL